MRTLPHVWPSRPVTGPHVRLDSRTRGQGQLPVNAVAHALLVRLRTAGELILGLVLSFTLQVAEIVLYLIGVAALAFGAFLMPLLLAPVVLLFGILIVTVGAIAGAHFFL